MRDNYVDRLSVVDNTNSYQEISASFVTLYSLDSFNGGKSTGIRGIWPIRYRVCMRACGIDASGLPRDRWFYRTLQKDREF